MMNKLDQINEALHRERNEKYCLFEGMGGRLLFDYMHQPISERTDGGGEEQMVGLLLNTYTAGGVPIYSFANGLSGSLWLLHYLNKKNSLCLGDDFFDEVDEIITAAACKYLSFENYDYLHGAAGMIFTLMMRPEKNRDALQMLTDRLLETRIEVDLFKVWEFRSPMSDRKNITINTGLAHGLGSMLVLLSKLYKNNIRPEQCLLAINECWMFLQKHRNPDVNDDAFSIYPTLIEASKPNSYTGRMAWCYGDLGIGTALYLTGKTIGDEKMCEDAIYLFDYYAQFSNDPKFLVRDASVCHGAAGVLHLFYRMYINTGKHNYQLASQYWLKVLMNMGFHKDGLAGYKVIYKDGNWANSTSLLEGIAGIGLVLSSYLRQSEPDWDECLFLS